ncbi:MAG: hypothetical protein ACOY46_19500 [Bacillota bacterium]
MQRSEENIKLLQELPDTSSRIAAVFLITMEWIESELGRDIYQKYGIYRMQMVMRGEDDRNLRSAFIGILEHVMWMGQEAGEIRQDISSEELAYQLEWLFASTVADWLIAPEKFSLQESVNRKIDMFWNGLAAREG